MRIFLMAAVGLLAAASGWGQMPPAPLVPDVPSMSCVALTDSAIAWAESQVKVRAPVSLLERQFNLDGGSRILLLVDAAGESVLLWKDNRMWIEDDSTGAARPVPPRLLYYRNQWSSTHGCNRSEMFACPVGSEAEQAWILILGDLVARTLTPEEQESVRRGRLTEDIGNTTRPIDDGVCALHIVDSLLRQQRRYPAGTVDWGY